MAGSFFGSIFGRRREGDQGLVAQVRVGAVAQQAGGVGLQRRRAVCFFSSQVEQPDRAGPRAGQRRRRCLPHWHALVVAWRRRVLQGRQRRLCAGLFGLAVRASSPSACRRRRRAASARRVASSSARAAATSADGSEPSVCDRGRAHGPASPWRPRPRPRPARTASVSPAAAIRPRPVDARLRLGQQSRRWCSVSSLLPRRPFHLPGRNSLQVLDDLVAHLGGTSACSTSSSSLAGRLVVGRRPGCRRCGRAAPASASRRLRRFSSSASSPAAAVPRPGRRPCRSTRGTACRSRRG